MKPKLFPIVFTLLVGLAACRQAAPPAAAPTAAATAVQATIAPTVEEPAAPETPTEAPVVPAADEPIAAVELLDPANSPIFGTPWTDRDPYAAGLIDSQQSLLSEQPNAPIYHMQVALSDDMQTVNGRQAIYYTNAEDVALDEVYFHLFPNLLNGDIQIAQLSVDGQPVAPVLEGPDDILLRVPLSAPLAPGESVAIEMDFTTTVPSDIGRNYGIFAYYDDVLALAHFYPQVAVYDAEGWATETPDIQGDVAYSDAAYYLVEVTAPSATQLVGGGIAIDSQTDGDTQTITYAAGPMRDYYLAASDRWTVISDSVNGVQVNSYGPIEYPEGVQMALDVAMTTLAGHSEWLVPYPYTEFDIISTPTAALGIEYPGIIANTERMYDLNAVTAAGVPWGVILEATTAHEVGHQWFYGLVGNDQLNEPWLDEAVTQYATYHYYLDRYGQRGGDGYFDSLVGRWDRVDGEAIPIGLPVTEYEDAEYGAIVYGRGPVFVRALADEMGEETFNTFLRDYVTTYRLRIATTAEFRALAESHCECDLGPLFAEWVYE